MYSIRLPFANRREAGCALAGYVSQSLTGLSRDQVVVVGLTRGGVPVAAEVALQLRVPLQILDPRVAPTIDLRESPLRHFNRPCLVVVDDGLETGQTMTAALTMLAVRNPMRMIAAAPVASPSGAARVRDLVSELVAVAVPSSFRCIADWYVDFSKTTPHDVDECRREVAHQAAQSAASPSAASSVRT